MSTRGVLEICEGDQLSFYCPGCEMHHGVYVAGSGHPVWGFNGNYDKPTFTPSILCRWRGFTPAGRAAYNAWADAGHPEPAPQFEARDMVCHSFVRDGQIQFLSDCTHALAGQTVPLEPIS